jgi:uncharacterized membrane protein
MSPAVIEYDGGVAGLFGWVLYGYGIPAAALWRAGGILRRGGPDPLAVICQTAAVAFGFLLVAFQARIWTAGAIDGYFALLDHSVQTLWWLIAAGLLLHRDVAAHLPTAGFGGAGLLTLACLQIVVGHLLWANPVWSDDPVGSWPVINLLGLAYLAPALALAWLAWDRALILGDPVRAGLRVGAALLVLIYVSLEVRRAFQGPLLDLARGAGGAEIYAYSAAWIALAAAALAVGIARRSAAWRHGALALLSLTVLKVFVYDMDFNNKRGG